MYFISELKRHAVTTFYLVASLSLLNSCKPQPGATGSGLSSVDNIEAAANGSLNLNRCTKDQADSSYDDYAFLSSYKLNKTAVVNDWMNKYGTFFEFSSDITDPAEKAKYLAAIRNVLEVVPVYVGVGIFNSQNLHIRIGHAVHPECQAIVANNAAETEGVDKPFYCWTNPQGSSKGGVFFSDGQIKNAAGATQNVSIEEGIQHGLLRGFLFLYFNGIFVATQSSTGLDPQAATHIQRFAAQSEQVATIFRGELKSALPQIDPFIFKRNLYVEALDSLSCSSATRQGFAQLYPATYAAFNGTGTRQ